METKVFEVLEVKLSILKKNPPILFISSVGNTRTGGWSNGRLEPYVYIVPPADGIYEFTFMATPPSGLATNAITPILAEPFFWDDFPKDLKGVKVYSETNHVIAKI